MGISDICQLITWPPVYYVSDPENIHSIICRFGGFPSGNLWLLWYSPRHVLTWTLIIIIPVKNPLNISHMIWVLLEHHIGRLALYCYFVLCFVDIDHRCHLLVGKDRFSIGNNFLKAAIKTYKTNKMSVCYVKIHASILFQLLYKECSLLYYSSLNALTAGAAYIRVFIFY